MNRLEVPIPSGAECREMLEGLLGREVSVRTGGDMVNPDGPGGAMVGAYVDRQHKLRALVLFDLPLAAWIGSAIGLIPKATAEGAVENGFLTTDIAENAGEVLNVCASLFIIGDSPHVRLESTYWPGDKLPKDIAPWPLSWVPRLDLDVVVAGYGKGQWSLLTVPPQ